MLIECRKRRPARGLKVGRKDNDIGTKVKLFGKHYHFMPRPELAEGKGDTAAHICEVNDKRAIERLLSIPEAYNELGRPPVLPDTSPKLAAGQPEIRTEMLDDDDVLAAAPGDLDKNDPLYSAKLAQQQWIEDQLSKPTTVLRRDVHDLKDSEIDLLLKAARARGETPEVLEVLETRPEPVTLEQAIHSLSHTDDENWTKSGLPAVEAVSAAYGGTVTREEIEKVAPDFKRDTASVANDESLNLE